MFLRYSKTGLDISDSIIINPPPNRAVVFENLLISSRDAVSDFKIRELYSGPDGSDNPNQVIWQFNFHGFHQIKRLVCRKDTKIVIDVYIVDSPVTIIGDIKYE